MADKVVTTDVLVLGGGLAGCMAAIRAREQGAKVTLVDKAAIKRSGDGGSGVFFYTSYFNSGPAWDTAERYRNWWRDIRHGLVDMKVVDELVIKNQPIVQAYVEKMGISLKDPRAGRASRLSRGTQLEQSAIAREHPRFFFNGENIKIVLSDRVRELGAEVIEKVHVTSLLTEDGRVVGATGFHNRDGDFYTFKAKTVIVAMGSSVRVYPTPNGNHFNNYHRPWHAGTGIAIIHKAGAEVVNFEFINPNFAGRWLTGVVTATVQQAGARFINGLGEPIVERTDLPGEWGVGNGMTYACYRELNAGRGPIYLDTRNISPEQIKESIKEQTGRRFMDMPLAPEYLERTAVELSGGLIELTPYLVTNRCSGHAKGTLVNEKCQSSVTGLYAIGDCCTASDSVSGCMTTGYVAGFEAARQAASMSLEEPDEVQIKEEKERVFAPLHRKGGTNWLEFEDNLQRIMIEHVGISRTQLGLKSAQAQFAAAQDSVPGLSADNLHDLMRVHEAIDTLTFDQIMTTAALERTETRMGGMMHHHRADYPQQDDDNWWGVAVPVKSEGGEMTATRRRLNPLSIRPNKSREEVMEEICPQ
ncbi:MAG: FAD-dependent oxidoreductase [Chloroflexi bacterium]|nr:FAD-dependent oxidoreductase [Chloroflexota bacterium]